MIHQSAADPSAAKRPVPSASPPGRPIPVGFANWNEFYALQHRLDRAAGRILAAGGAGNASIVVATPARELRVYWHGPLPGALRALARGLGVTVRFRAASFTFRALSVQAQRLAALPGVAVAAAKPDGSGLDVTVARTAAARALPGAMTASSIPLSITTGQRPQFSFDRQADTPEFWGGSRYTTALGGCSNGFALSVPGDYNVWMISAAHCGDFAQSVDIAGQPSPTGSIHANAPCRDTMAIAYPQGVFGRIYAGPFDSSSSNAVTDAGPDYVGDYVETGGAASGEHDDISVTAVDVYASLGGAACTEIGPLTQAGYSDASCAEAPGDSGGPVYTFLVGGGREARGTITAGDPFTATCPGLHPDGSNAFYYAPLLRPDGDPQIGSLQFYGWSILAG